MRENFPFLLAVSNANLKPGCLLKWLVKDVTFLLPLVEVMKIIRLTSLLPNMLHLSSPRLRHGRRLALLSLSPTSDPKSVYFLLHAHTGSYSSLSFPNCSFPRKSASVFVNYLIFHFSVSQPKALHSRAEATFAISAKTCALRSFIPLSSPSSTC